MERRHSKGPSRPAEDSSLAPTPSRASFLPTTTAQAFLAGFEALGLDGGALRTAAGIRPEELETLDGVLPGDCFGALWAEAFRQAPREELPTEVALAIPFGAFGTVDYLASTSATVQSAFHSLRAHFHQVGTFGLELVEDGDGAAVQLVHPAPFEGQEVSDELTLALFVARFRSKTLERVFQPRAVRLTRPAPVGPTRHEALLGAPVQFGCRTAALELTQASWVAPMPDADPTLQLTLRRLADRLELGQAGTDLELALRARLRASLPSGEAEASTAARALGLSERTLHRRLQEQGRTWRQVLETFREAEAERLLGGGRAALADVALRLGFSDQTAWNRAFKRWKGMSPTEWVKAQSRR